jgi:hypothetical protein
MHAEGYTSIWIGTDMEKLLENKSASPSEINLLLTTMLRYAGLEAEPLIISTRDHRPAVGDFPDINQFNHTICYLKLDGKPLYLDASSPTTPFGHLPYNDYNGYARVVSEKGSSLILDASKLADRSLVTIKTEKPDVNDYIMKVSYTFGSLEAKERRDIWIRDTSSLKGMVLSMVNNAGMDAGLIEYKLSGLGNPDTSLSLSFNMRLIWTAEGKSYFNPHFVSALARNPFSAAKRVLPIELPAAQDAYANIDIRLPEGYRLIDGPQPRIVNVNTADYFKYLVAYDEPNHSLQVSSRIHTERTWYPPGEYDLVKRFYEKIIAQQQATYVFSK